MKQFEYYTPTRVIFGKNTENRVGQLLKEQKATKVLIHYGSGSARRSGLLDRVEESLKEAGIPYVMLGGAVPNPRLSKVYEGIALGKKEGVDFILAVGGGSAIDSAKGIGYGLCYEGDVWDFYLKKCLPKASVPVGVILTMAATGSEMSNSSVITKEEGWLKRSAKSDLGRPRFAILNPELTYTLPEYQTMSGCVDIMMHTMERYFSHERDTELVDSMAEGLLRTMMHNAAVLLEEPGNYEARSEVMWAGSLSHNGLTGCGRKGDWACHQLEHELGGMFDVAHGAGLSALWGSWARYVYETDVERFVQFAVRVMGIEENLQSPKETALLGIQALEEFFRSIHMPVSISELGCKLTEENIRELAYKCSFMDTRTIGGFRELNREDMEKIYRMAR